jgi:hypothetical protein
MTEKTKEEKVLTVETGLHGNIWIDGAHADDDKDILCYKGFKFKFIGWCSRVTPQQIGATKKKFKSLGMI